MEGNAEVAWLRAQPDANVVEVVARLLRACREGQAELRARWDDPRYEPRAADVTREVERTLRDASSLRVDAPMLAAIAAILDAASAQIGEPYAARAVAGGIDAALGPRFGDYFDRDDGRDLQLGDPFPIHEAPTLTLVARNDSPGKPSNLTPPLLRTPHLGIVGDDLGIAINLTCVGPRLRPPRPTSSVAMISTNGDIAELSFDVYDQARQPPGPDTDWSSGKGYFYNVRPGGFGADAAEQRLAIDEQKQRLARGLQIAAGAECDVVVLPECCSTDEIHAWLLGLDAIRRIPLLVLGSRHRTTESGLGPGTNEAAIFLRGSEVGRVTKFANFNLRLPSVAKDVSFYEDLDRNPRLHLLAGAGASVVVLICKDAMNGDVQEIVRSVSPTFLLVPTMSPELGPLEAAARALAYDPQIITVTANVGPVTALVVRPSKTKHVIEKTCSPGRVVQVMLSTGDSHIL